jgi:hypothetical protein
MHTTNRITSIFHTKTLDLDTSGISTFHLTDLHLDKIPEFELPNNIRLGHLAEKVVSGLIEHSKNFKIVYENIQIIENGKTIGELDFILEEIKSRRLLHLELAYKFYLFDPSLSNDEINCWIGPNRNDCLHEKLNKLKEKQFPLLHSRLAKSALKNIEIKEVKQYLCLLASLYVPFEFQGNLSPIFEKNIVGYYLNYETFFKLDHLNKTYIIPNKKEWGNNPSEYKNWLDYSIIQERLEINKIEKQATLIWQKIDGSFSSIFIVWW